MAYLHENIEEFTNAVNLASEQYSILPVVAEKDEGTGGRFYGSREP